MKKVELLSPVGNMESLFMAVNGGADAVYLGGKKFGARAYANNFDDIEMVKAIKYCHLYGVKIYVTVNTIIYEKEFQSVIDYIEFLHINGVDAIIMQDLGLISYCRNKFPNLEIHASTQAHNHNKKGLLALKELGITRVVLARELSLNEINSIDVDIEKEVFIHGALCISYSGCCLFSSMNGKRSGNRGECVGSCRLPYSLYEDDKKISTKGDYLISAKTLCTATNIEELLKTDITSFKIEGRMKSPFYVGYITRLYRSLIDKYYENQPLNITEEELNNIKLLYNQELTNGFLFTDSKSSIVNVHSPNHIGIPIGEVISYDPKYIKIKLTKDLNQEDGIRLPNNEGMIVNRLYDEKLLLVNSVKKGSIAIVDNKINLNILGKVLKTIDVNLHKTITSMREKKIPINIECIAKLNNRLELIIDDGINKVKKIGPLVEQAINTSTISDRIEEQLTKLGNTPFIKNNVNILADQNIFISIKELNEIRRVAIEELIIIRENSKKEVIINNEKQDIKERNTNNSYSLSILVRNEEQLITSLELDIDRIYVTDYNLYEKYKTKDKIYYRTKRVSSNQKNFSNENLLVTELGGINKYSKNNKVISDYYLNVVNSKTIKYLENLNVSLITLSPELDYLKAIDIKDHSKTELIIYGRIEVMVMSYCPINKFLNNEKIPCNYCSNNKNYYLVNKALDKYPMITDTNITHILHHKPIDYIEEMNTYMKIGITNYRVELFDEKKEDIIRLFNKIKKVIK